MGSGVAFGMILNTEADFARAFDALNRAIVQIYVGYPNIRRQRLRIDSIAVILRRHIDRAEKIVFDRVIATAMTEWKFVGRCA